MRNRFATVLLMLGLVAGPARADLATVYYGLGVADGQFEGDGGDDMSLGTLNATLGVEALDVLGVELEAGVASDQTDSLFSEPQLHYQAAMLRLGWRWDRIAVYGLGGQARLELDDALGELRLFLA